MTPIERAARRTFHSLRIRNFRVYFIGQVISGAGSWVQLVAQSWLVLQLTHSAAAVGITLGLQFAPLLLFGAWAGVLVDRLDKRRLLIGTATATGVLALVLGVVTIAGVVEVWMVYVLATGVGIVTALDNPARRAFVPELVPPADLANAVGLNSSVFNAARVIGPAVGALVIAGVGVGWCFILNAASFVAVVWALAAMHRSELRPTPPLPRAKRQLREGLRYSWDNRPVRIALLMTAVVGTFSFNYQVIMPVLVRDEFGGGAGTYGLAMMVLGCGSLLGALSVAHRGHASLRVTIRMTILLGVAMTAAAIAPTLGVELAVLPFVGLTSMVMLVMGTAVCQEETAPEFRGRVMALFGIAFLGSTPIGAPIVGWVCQTLGPRAGLAMGAAAAVATGVIAHLTYHRADHDVSVDASEIALTADASVAMT
jgi:MFS family permease